MTQPPVELTYGTVKWWVATLISDSDVDTNDLPELRPINGRAFIVPDVADDALFLTGVANPLTLLKARTELLIVDGHLQDRAGNRTVKLLANDSPGLAQTGWSYTLSFELDDGLTFGSFPFYLTTNQAVDLTTVAPLLTPEPGVIITKGDPGPPGPGFVFRGAWAASTSYDRHDVVTSDGSVFMVVSGHVSGTTAPTVATPGINYALWAAKGEKGEPGTGAVSSVNGYTGAVVLAAADVGAQPAGDYVVGTDPRLSDARPPLAHDHPEYLDQTELDAQSAIAATGNALMKRDASGRSQVANAGTALNDVVNVGTALGYRRQGRVSVDSALTPNYAVGLGDEGKSIEVFGTAATPTVTIPADVTADLLPGSWLYVQDIGATNSVTIAAETGVTLRMEDGANVLDNYGAVLVRKSGANTWQIVGHGYGTSAAVANTYIKRGADGRARITGGSGPSDIVNLAQMEGGDYAFRRVQNRAVDVFNSVNTTLVFPEDEGLSVELFGTATAPTVTIPTNAAENFQIGSWVQIVNNGTSEPVTVVGATGVTVRGAAGAEILRAGEVMRVRKVDTDVWQIDVRGNFNNGVSQALAEGENIALSTDPVTGVTTIHSTATGTGTGTVDLTTVPAGYVHVHKKNGGVWDPRPSTRTDIVVAWVGADPNPDVVLPPSTGGAYDSSNALGDVRWVQ